MSAFRILRRTLFRIRRYMVTRLRFAWGVWLIEFSPLMSPWCQLRRSRTEIGRLRRFAADFAWKSTTVPLDRAVLVVLGLAWPLYAAARAVVLVAREGGVVRNSTGVSRFRQWREAVRIAITLNHGPGTYYNFRLFNAPGDPSEFIGNDEMSSLQLCELGQRGIGDIRDKLLFHDACTRAGVATVPVVVAMLPEQPDRWIARRGELGARDLFVKWTEGEGGVGGERWTYDHDRQMWARRGQWLNRDALLGYCRQRARRQGVLVQHALSNHPDLAVYGERTLHTLRVVTYRDENASAVFTRATMKLGRAGADVDNVYAGGIVAALDPATGTLSVARGGPPSKGDFEEHPDSGARISGAALGITRNAIALALAAHDALNVPWSVGWDVAMTPDGPVIIEGNSLWGAQIVQLPHGAPLPAHFTSRLLQRVLSR